MTYDGCIWVAMTLKMNGYRAHGWRFRRWVRKDHRGNRAYFIFMLVGQWAVQDLMRRGENGEEWKDDRLYPTANIGNKMILLYLGF